MQRFTPNGPGKTSMKYEVYRHKDSSDKDFDLINQMYKRIMSEDKYLCDEAQKNLNAGVFVNGELHPRMEKGPLYFQKYIRNLVAEHRQKEADANGEIWPSRQMIPESAKTTEKDIQFCSAVDCCRLNVRNPIPV